MTVMQVDDLSYTIVRSRRTTADIVIERDGAILVRVPQRTSDEKIADIVKAKRYWIYKHQAEWKYLNAKRVSREFRNGEAFLYLGRAYRLRLVSNQDQALVLRDGRFCLRRELVEDGKTAAARTAFRNYYISRGNERMGPRVDYYAAKVGVIPKAVDIRDLGHRWAACSARGKLAFHWKCMMAPQTVLDYIIVHELCHFHYFDHSDKYWNEVDKVMPSYRERKEWLRKYGASLDV